MAQLQVRVAMGWSAPWSQRALVTLAAWLVLSVLPAPSAAARAFLQENASSVDCSHLPPMSGVPLGPEGWQGYMMVATPANAGLPVEAPTPDDISLEPAVLLRPDDRRWDCEGLGPRRACVRPDDSPALLRAARVSEDPRARVGVPPAFAGESRDLRLVVRCDRRAPAQLRPFPDAACPEVLSDHDAACPDAACPDARPCLDAACPDAACPDARLCRPTLAAAWAPALLASAALVLRRLWLRVRAGCGRGPAVRKPPCRKAQVRTFRRLGDLCAICLEDYEEGERLKILPCSHAYHCRCIDPWFSRAARRSCPLCEQSVASTWDGSASGVDSFSDEDASLPGRRPPLWAVQAGFRLHRLQLLAGPGPCRRCSATLVGGSENVASSEGSPEPP